MLAAHDPLRHPARKILVAGVTGAGKSTLAKRIGAAVGAPYTEIDGLYHGPNWTPLPTFLADVDALIAQPSWVTEWQYRSARDRLAAGADTLVWLDYPARVTVARLVRRTLRRRRTREKLWAGNVEPPLWHFLVGKDHIFAWAIATRRKYKESVPALERSSPHLQVIRLRTPGQAEAWLAGALIERL